MGTSAYVIFCFGSARCALGARAQSHAERDLMEHQGPHVLVVESSETQALMMMALLEDEGIHARRSSTAEEALDHLRHSRPDLILVDDHLPRMRGDELCRQMQINPATRDISILILTDDVNDIIGRQGIESGADDYVPKSTEADALMARVHALLDKRRMAPGRSFHRPATAFHKHRVVVVDDSPTYLAYVEQELEHAGYTVATFAGGEAAIRHLNREGCDCILVDLVMPDIDGIELCRRLDQFRDRTGLWFPVLMVTGQDAKEDMMRALEAGADDFVSKSSDIAILRARIQALLRRKAQRDEQERISYEFRRKELEVVRERAEREAAERRAVLAEELEKANSELKETQLQLVQTAKMASLGELVAGIAHEINNPLSYVMSHLDTVEQCLNKLHGKIAGHLSDPERTRYDKARTRLDGMRGGLQRVRDLVLKLLTFSRLDEGEFKKADVRENIESILTILGHRFGDKVTVDATYASDNTIWCFPAPLNQVVMNLLSNAIDAVEEGGLIEVRTERGDAAFTIVVADDGAGIPPDIRERVFEPFFTTKPVGRSVGLGLAIGYRIVQAHKGSIEIRDKAGGGTEFAVTIPLDLREESHAC